MGKINEQEQEAIEAYAKEIMKSGCVSNERDFLDGILKGAEFALSELHKPSEKLIQEILNIISREAVIGAVEFEGSFFNILILKEWYFDKTAREIAKLMQPDVNAELLKALKNAVLFIKTCPRISNDQQPKGLDRWDELVQTIEKQSK
jgi:arginyl-tRNA synthetase